MIQPEQTLIVAKPGPLREGLRAALNAMPRVAVVAEADEFVSALEMQMRQAPSLIVLSVDTPGRGALDAWRQIKAHWPQTQCIILADTVQQQEMARAAGAATVLLKGFAAEKLFATVESLFGEPGEGHPAKDPSTEEG